MNRQGTACAGSPNKAKENDPKGPGFFSPFTKTFQNHSEQPGSSNFKSEEWEIPGQGIWSVSQRGRQLGAEYVSTYSQNDGEEGGRGPCTSQPLPQPSQPYLELKYSLRNDSTS